MKNRFRIAILLIGLTISLVGRHSGAEQSDEAPPGNPEAGSVSELIERNQQLRDLYEINPEAASAIARLLLAITAQTDTGSEDGTNDGETVDPDIDALRRSSPQAVLDLIELMKRASEARRPDPRKRTGG